MCIGARPMWAGSTGHSYIVYARSRNGATTLMFEGIPNYPDVSALLECRRQASGYDLLHRATAIRALMQNGEGPVKSTSRKSLRLLGSVGEPINPEAWEWYYHVV